MWTKGLWSVCLSLALLGFLGVARAAEKGEPAKAEAKEAKEDKEAKAPEPKAKPLAREDVVAKVGDVEIGRADLDGARRFFAMTNPKVQLTGKQVLEQVINRILWSKYFEKNNLRPTPAELQQAVGQIEAKLREQNMTLEQMLARQGMRAQDYLGMLSYDLAMQKLIAKTQSEIKVEEIKAEYDAHPDWYDGSKVRLSQIFVDTSNIAQDPKELEKAKDRVDQIYTKLENKGDFDRLAADYSEGAGAGMGGDRGWFARKGADVDEPLMAAVWALKVGDFTKPILGARGWQILKVTEREPAAFTFFGCKPRIVNELTRKRLEALLDELKAASKIEINI